MLRFENQSTETIRNQSLHSPKVVVTSDEVVVISIMSHVIVLSRNALVLPIRTALTLIALLHVCCSSKQELSKGIMLRRQPNMLRNDEVWSLGCLKESWFRQRLDHFQRHRGDDDATFQQRYFLCDEYWSQNPGGSRGPIFFYAGNEADVTLYVNATGLIWEHAEEFGALVLFVEHRYYGKTQPVGPDSWKTNPSYLSVEQALADYAVLLWHLTGEVGAVDSPVIAFGGSYGGMLAAWMRLKYPHLVAGAVAASAPVGAFPGVAGWQPSRFWAVVTYDATASAGAAPECASNVRTAFGQVQALGRTASGRTTLAQLLRLCDSIVDESAAESVAYWLQSAFDAFAMGNYPYSSSYISDDPDHPLPAWPMKAACSLMVPGGEAAEAGEAGGDGELRLNNLVEALRDAAGVLYNVTGRVNCYSAQTSGPAAGNRGPWDYQWCTELMAQELPYYPANGVSDMFWNQGPFDMEVINAHCLEAWGVTPMTDWSALTYGGLDYRAASNIVFSNGLYDPWSAYGILTNISDTVVAIIIPEGAHHVDLMYSNPADPPSLKAARKAEMTHVWQWVRQHYQGAASARKGARRQPQHSHDGVWAQAGSATLKAFASSVGRGTESTKQSFRRRVVR